MDEDGAAPSIPGVPFDKFPLEIQSQIANYLDKKSLFNTILVNKEWFLRLIDLVWHTASISATFTNPARIRTKGRRQYYAAKIRRAFIGSAHNPSLYKGLEFRSIQRLEVHSFDNADEFWLLSLLKPTLQTFVVKQYCDMNTRVLDSLRSCPQLQALALKGLAPHRNEENLLAYLREAPSLRTVILQPGRVHHTGDGPLLVRTLNTLLRRGNLESLVLCSDLTEDWFTEHSRTTTEPFPLNANLQLLRIQGYGPAAAVCLSTATACLNHLHLTLHDPKHDLFEQFRNFSNLTSLSLRFTSGRTHVPLKIKVSDLDVLRTLTKLIHLTISNRSYPRSKLEWMTDAYFASWISHFGNLRNLNFDLQCNLTRAAVVSIARSCPHLVRLTLGWRLNLGSWTGLVAAAPLLPQLRSLVLEEVRSIDANSNRMILTGARVSVIVPTICTLFPSLQTFRAACGPRTFTPLNNIVQQVLDARRL